MLSDHTKNQMPAKFQGEVFTGSCQCQLWVPVKLIPIIFKMCFVGTVKKIQISIVAKFDLTLGNAR